MEPAPQTGMGHTPLPRHRPAPVPGPERLRHPGGVRAVLRAAGRWASANTWAATANLVISLVLGWLFALATACALLLAALTVWILGAGTTVRAGVLWLAVQMAQVDRRRLERLCGVRISPPALPRAEPGARFRARQDAWASSPWLWRLAAYQIVRLPVVCALAFE